jgi:SHS2 domain-containing protein
VGPQSCRTCDARWFCAGATILRVGRSASLDDTLAGGISVATNRGVFTTEAPANVCHDRGTELELALEAPSLKALFEGCGRALADVMGGDQCAGRVDGDVETVMLQASDTQALLVEWLNELIFRSGMRGRAYTELDVDYVDSNRLTASIRGVHVEHFAVKVAAASWRRLTIEKIDGVYRVTVVLEL